MPTHIAIGDIHGMVEPLGTLLNLIPSAGELIFTGDYIDRGPKSKYVLKYLQIIAEERPCIFLRGNHEQWAIDTPTGNPLDNMRWLENGGDNTYANYDGPTDDDDLEFVKNTKMYHETEKYIFVHAGLKPGILKAADTDDHTKLWIRDEFLNSSFDWGKLIIHGHTPTCNGEPEIRDNRIRIDTGVANGGKLTAILLPEMEFLFARR